MMNCCLLLETNCVIFYHSFGRSSSLFSSVSCQFGSIWMRVCVCVYVWVQVSGTMLFQSGRKCWETIELETVLRIM